MANTIRLKRASGSDPGASDLVTGELAVRTDTAKLFTKKDDNSVAEIGASVGTDDVDTAAIQDDAVTFAKIQNIGNNKIAGRTSSGTGNIEQLSAANVRSIINVEDGATADQTASEIKTLLNSDGIVNANVDASAAIDGSKIDPSFTSNISTTGQQLQFTNNAGGRIKFSDANNNPDYMIRSSQGKLQIDQNDDSTPIFKINSDGHVDINNNLDCGDGLDVTGNITVSGTVDGRDVATDGTKLDGIESGATADQTKSDIDGLGIAASTAATLATARTIAGVSFDGSANISLNNNAITNGAGYITATLTNEQVQDIVGGMLTGNTETGITVTYQDGDGTIDFVVGTLNQDTTGNAATATALETARNIGGVSFDGTGNINLPGVNTSGNQNTSGNAATATKLATARTIAGVSFDGSANISLNNNAITNGAGYITSADGGNAATLDSIDSSQFARSDTADTLSGLMTFSGGISLGADARCAAGVSSLSDGSTITVNFTSGIHHSVTLGGNRTFGNPSNDSNAVGQSGSIFITQDGTGSRTASFHSDYKFVGGTAPTLSTAANAVDRLDYVIKASGVIHCVVSLDVK